LEKLYRTVDGQTQYWEYWALKKNTFTVHTGDLGTRGKSRTVRGPMAPRVAKARAQGFAPISEDAHHLLVVEYTLEGWGRDDDLGKRHALEERLNETLGWTGLGHCDGGDIGSGAMACYLVVVDVDVAKRVIEDDLKGTRFSDYSRLFRHPM
jgi:hypothetical protein